MSLSASSAPRRQLREGLLRCRASLSLDRAALDALGAEPGVQLHASYINVWLDLLDEFEQEVPFRAGERPLCSRVGNGFGRHRAETTPSQGGGRRVPTSSASKTQAKSNLLLS
jgi:hypothetical protein